MQGVPVQVLIVDNDRKALRQLAEAVRELGQHPRCHDDPDEAFRAWQADPCLFVLMSWRQASGTGPDLCRRIRASKDGDRPFLLLVTGRDREEDAVDALEAGADDYLLRPLRPAELALRLRIGQARLAIRVESREKAAALDDLLTTSEELILTLSPSGEILFANRTWCDIVGVGETEAEGHPLMERLAPDARAAFRRRLDRCVREQVPERISTAFLSRAGVRVHVEGTMLPRMQGMTLTSIRCILRDISRRQRAEDALRGVLEATGDRTGEPFLRSLARHVASSLGVSVGLVAEGLPTGRDQIRSLATWHHDAYEPMRTWTLPGWRRLQDSGGSLDTQEIEDGLCRELGQGEALVVPLRSSVGEVIGILGVLHEQPTGLDADAGPLLRLFAQRASAELERLRTERALGRRQRHAWALAALDRTLLAWDGAWTSLRPVLAGIARAAGAVRTVLLERPEEDADEEHLIPRVEWSDAGVRSLLETLGDKPISLQTLLGPLADRLMGGDVLLVERDQSTEALARLMERDQLRAGLVAPLFLGETFAGVLVFHYVDPDACREQAQRDLAGRASTALSMALQRQRDRTRMGEILSTIDEIVWSLSSRDHRRLYVNPAVERVFGRPQEDFYARPDAWGAAIHPDDAERVDAFIESLHDVGSGEIEYRILRPDGGVRWIRDSAHVARDALGRPFRFDGVASDITKERRSRARQEAFATLGERLNRAGTATEAARIIFDVADALIGWDAAWMDLGDPRGENPLRPILYMDLVDGARREITPRWAVPSHQALAGHLKAHGGQHLRRDVDLANAPWVDATDRSQSFLFVPIRAGAELVGMLSIQSYRLSSYGAEDLETLQSLADHCGGALRRTEVEVRLREAQRRAQAMLDAMPDLVVRVDRQGRYLDVRAPDERLLVTPLGEGLDSCTVTSRLPPGVSDLWLARIRAALDEDRIQVFEYELPLRGGIRHFEARAAPCGADEVVVVSRDISARLHAEQDRLAIERTMQESQKLESLGVLAGGIAHDFNNLLTSIMGFASLARMKLDPADVATEYLQDIEEATQGAADLAMLMLAYSGKGQFVIQPLDLAEVVRTTEGLLYAELLKLRSILVVDIAPAMPAVEGDAAQLRQVLLNLVLNGAQAMAPAGGVVRLTISDAWVAPKDLRGAYVGEDASEGRYARIVVKDTGRGMDEATLARIFDPFFTTKETGRGLGLAAVVGIVRGHHGALQVESVPDHGTTFTIHLPLCEVQAPVEPVAESADGSSGEGLVMVVDDEEGVRRLAREILSAHGYQVLTAEHGEAALAHFREHHARMHAVLLDMTMPGASGAEVMAEMRHLDPRVHILLSSGYSEAEAVGGMSGVVPDGFLQKPYRAPQLLRAIQDLGAPRATVDPS